MGKGEGVGVKIEDSRMGMRKTWLLRVKIKAEYYLSMYTSKIRVN